MCGQEWTKDDCVQILEAVVERAPELAHVPVDLRTRSSVLGAAASARCASGGSVVGDDSGDENDENDDAAMGM